MINVNSVKIDPKKGFIPVTNIWCAHTTNERMAMNNIEPTIALYPKIGLRELVAMISEDNPKAGNNTMYTSGWPKNQNRCWNKTGLPPWFGNASPPM